MKDAKSWTDCACRSITLNMFLEFTVTFVSMKYRHSVGDFVQGGFSRYIDGISMLSIKTWSQGLLLDKCKLTGLWAWLLHMIRSFKKASRSLDHMLWELQFQASTRTHLNKKIPISWNGWWVQFSLILSAIKTSLWNGWFQMHFCKFLCLLIVKMYVSVCKMYGGAQGGVYPRLASDSKAGITHSLAAFVVDLESWEQCAGWWKPKPPSCLRDWPPKPDFGWGSATSCGGFCFQQDTRHKAAITRAGRTGHLSTAALGATSQKSAFPRDVLRKDPHGTSVHLRALMC